MFKFRAVDLFRGVWVEGHYLYSEKNNLHTIRDTDMVQHHIKEQTLQVQTTDGWENISDVHLVRKKSDVSGSLPIEEVALHAADDWFDTAKLRSDVRADLKSYYEGYRDAMRFCQGNGC